jgi:hypothetical protein
VTQKTIHIITHDVPFPADFGGVIDLYYKIRALHAEGVDIHLHCFVKNRPPSEELLAYCRSVHYYQRKKISRYFFRLPYIVAARNSNELNRRLVLDNHPVLIEGIHCSYPLYAGLLKNRSVLLRLHNAEFVYYRHLYRHEKKPFRKIYYLLESRLLHDYERKLSGRAPIAAVSAQDVDAYRKHFSPASIRHIPVFLPYTQPKGLPGKGTYCLYHGNLQISENEEAACWLLEEVFSKVNTPFVIAGKNPGSRLRELAHRHQHTCLVENPSDAAMQDMIAKAQINILPSFNDTGVKLKILNALYNGRHSITNKKGAEGIGPEGLCSIAEDADELIQTIGYLYDMPYAEEDNAQREKLLCPFYDARANAHAIMELLGI